MDYNFVLVLGCCEEGKGVRSGGCAVNNERGKEKRDRP